MTSCWTRERKKEVMFHDEVKNLENVLTNGRQTMRKIQTSAFDTHCLRQVKEERQTTAIRRKRSRDRTDEPEATKPRISFLKFLWFSLVASFSSVLFSSSFFFLLSSVFLLLPDEDTKCRNRLFVSFSSIVVHWWVHFPSSFPHVST